MDQVWFTVNGVKYSVGCEVDSTVTLLDFIRTSLSYFGTKYMCREGGCGACIVSVSQRPGAPATAVNSCLVSVTSCQDWDITTIENIGNRFKGYHELQKSLAKGNGTQCGHCSPGWIMAMYSLLQSNPNLTMLEIEKSFASNICRCTGYRPILDTFKKYATDAPKSLSIADIEDLKLCDQSNINCKGSCKDQDWCFVSKDVGKETIKHIYLSDNRDWYLALTVSDIFKIFKTKGDNSYMLVAGNTAKGVYPINEYPRVLIDVAQVKELKGYVLDQNLVIGAGSTITEVIEIFKTVSKTDNFTYLSKLNDHLNKVGHIAVRNIGTIAGNLVIKNQHHEFPSDIFLLFQTVGAQITIVNSIGIKRTLKMQDFLSENLRGKVILNVLLPPLNQDNKLVTFKIMPRAQNAQAILNAGFLYTMKSNNKVTSARITYGGLSPIFTTANATEKFLVGQMPFDNETLQLAIQVLDKELVVTENPPVPSAAYRRQLAVALFYKGLLSLCPPNIISSRYLSGAIQIHDNRPVSKGQQVFDTDPSLWPLNQPVTKLEALIQCSGEAKYTEDVPPIPEEVFASFALSTVPLGNLESIDSSEALKQPGVIAFYSAKEIRGVNSFTPAGNIFYPTNEELLCGGEVKFYNQPIGIIVAESRHIADTAAKLVTATYSNVRKPVIDIKVAREDTERRTLFTTHNANDRGTDVFRKIEGETTIYGQYHFCLETLVCISLPSEQGIDVYPSSQWMDGIQVMTSRALNMQQNSINVYITRLGGAFGIKISRVNQVAVSCNMVVQKLNRPCRFIQSLPTNMRAIGKRLPCSTKFEVEVNAQGVIQYLKYSLFEDNGYIINEPFIMIGDGVYNNCYKASRWDFTSYNVVTDTHSNSWMRSPGSLESIVMAECLMERIAYEISMDPLQLRLANLDVDNYKDLIEMIDNLKESSDYERRRSEVEKFNSKNRWMKRGLRFSLMRWAPSGGSVYDINLSVYHDDGTVDIVHSGIEMGQGVNTKAAQVCAYFLKIPLEKIKVKGNSTIGNPNGFISGGSQTSLNIALGVQRACEQLLGRLEPIRTQLGNPTWEELISNAFNQNVDLQAHGFINRNDVQMYNVYGVAVAEVEVDILTGESEVLRVDLIEDVGQSVSPEVDVGQVEGAFVMGLGYWLWEQLVYNQTTGEILTNRSWNYKVPQARDIPQDFRVAFRKNSYGSSVFLGAKAIGEPPTCLAVVVPFALREAITSARQDSGIPTTQWFQVAIDLDGTISWPCTGSRESITYIARVITVNREGNNILNLWVTSANKDQADGPWTVEKICMAAATNYKEFKFY